MEPLKVLFVDDDLEFGQIITLGLTSLGHKVHFQTSLAGMDEAIVQFAPAMIVLDVEIGEDNGIDKAKELLSLFPSIPILFVSSHTDVSFVTKGIAAGGVNYLKKPFDIRELDAYIRRFARKRPDPREIRIGQYLLKPETSEWFYENFLIKVLAPMEKNAMTLLWDSKNSPVTRDLLTTALWGREYTPDLDARIYNVISKLRKLLNKDERVWISSESGKGYQLTVL